MRVVIVNKKKFDRAPDRIWCLKIIQHLRALGHDVRLLTAAHSERHDFGLGDAIRYLPTSQSAVLHTITFCLALYPTLAFQIICWQPDVVLLDVYSFWAAIPWDWMARAGLTSTRFVLDFRAMPSPRPGQPLLNLLERWLFAVAAWYGKRVLNGITVLTPQMRDYLEKLPGPRPSRLAIWSSGVEPADFDPQTVTPAPRPPMLKGAFVALYHGAFGFNRGLIEAVEAMHLLREACPTVRLWLVGDGPAYAAVQERIAALRLEERVLLQPALPYELIPPCVKLCDVGLLAYPNAEFWHTSNPLKLLEYMAMGKPVILRDIEAFRAAIADSGCGLFLHDNAPATVARALAGAYQRRHELPALGAGGRARVLAQYTWAAQARTLAAFFTAVARPEMESA